MIMSLRIKEIFEGNETERILLLPFADIEIFKVFKNNWIKFLNNCNGVQTVIMVCLYSWLINYEKSQMT